MLLTKITEVVPVTPEQLYARWVDVNSHPEWSTDLEWVEVPEPIRAGSKGQIKPREAKRPYSFKVTEMSHTGDTAVFADATPLSLARLVFRHSAKAVPNGSQVTVTCSVEGIMRSFWSRLLRSAADPVGMRQDLTRLVALIEAEQSASGVEGLNQSV